ncbi:dynactin subunit 2-like [Haliotis rubra]|uniref:dynactin subunit 2-like n=1 Tax=Haliotis rubra TaxID=36100 RepID=UPI001EE60801|nr:dynactin subunit 2-like [Haliotis rubra]
MADPKYANLPGIDHNSPDVFETNELPEDDQAIHQDATDVSPDCVEKLPIDTKAAHSIFKGKEASSSGIDFSDRISKSRRTGYDVHQAEYEILEQGSTAKETPQQKYQRLQHEIRELAEEVNQIKDTVKDEKSTEKLSPVQMGKQLEYLQHQLVDLHLEKLLGPEASVDLSDPQGALRKRLMSQIDAYKPVQAAKNVPANQQGGPDHVTYELYYRPEQAQFSKNARVASLEERLERLEAVLGQNVDKMTLLTNDTDNKSVVGAVSVLNSKLSLLEQSNLEQVDIRLQSVLQKLTQIAEKKASQEDVEKQKKVSELYELVKKWESVADSLPQVVDRMVALKDLHEQALQFSQALTHLDTSQQEINGSLKAHTDMLAQLQGTFKQNTDAIKKNCESLESRIKVLQK